MRLDEVDFANELRRIRVAHGLDPEVPQHIRDEIAALLASAPMPERERPADA